MCNSIPFMPISCKTFFIVSSDRAPKLDQPLWSRLIPLQISPLIHLFVPFLSWIQQLLMYQEDKPDTDKGSMRKKMASEKKRVGTETNDPSDTDSRSQTGSMTVSKEDQQSFMVLSSEARQALIEMQRFDRFIYVMESEKRLKGPIENELKRLERLKNAGNKSIKNTYFDNELTITCLFNHMKNMYEMNRDLGEIVVLKAEIEALQQKIIEQNMKYNKDVKEASSTAKGKFAEDSQQLKDILKMHESIISALKEPQPDKGKKKLEQEIKKATESSREMLELISGLISKACGETSGAIIDTYTGTLDRIMQDQGDVTKNIVYLEKERKALDKLSSDPKGDHAKKRVYQQLQGVVEYILSVYGMVKGDSSGSATQKGQDTGGSAQDKKLLKDLQNQIKAMREDGEMWIKEFESLAGRLQSDENILTDINKHRKLLNVKKNMDPTLSKYTDTVLNILDLVNRKARDQSQSLNADKERANQLSQLTKNNAALEKELQKTREELAAHQKKAKEQAQSSNADKEKANQIAQLTKTNAQLEKDLQQLRQELANLQKNATKVVEKPTGEVEWGKLITMIDQAFQKREENDPNAQSELLKVRKFIELNRKKFPAEAQTLLNTVENLVNSIINNDQFLKQQELEEQRRLQLEAKDVASLDVFTKTLEKLLTSGDPLNDGLLNKLKKNLETTFAKLDKQQESSSLSLYLGNLNNTWKVIELLDNAHQLSKANKGEGDVKKTDLDKLREQLKAKELEFKAKEQELKARDQEAKTRIQELKAKEQELKTLKLEGGNAQKKFKDYERRIQELEGKEANQKISTDEQKKERLRVQGLQRDLEGLKRERDALKADQEKEIKRLTKQLTASTNNSSNTKDLERQNEELRRSIEGLNKSANENKNSIREIDRLKRELDQLKSIQAAQQESSALKNEENENLKRRIKELEKSSKNEVKFVETRAPAQGAEYWIQRYQSSKMENEMLRDELASLERRFDEISVTQPYHTITVTRVGEHLADTEVSRLKGQIANQEAVRLSRDLEIDRLKNVETESRVTIENQRSQIRTLQLNMGNNQEVAIQQQLNSLVSENQTLKDELNKTKHSMGATASNLNYTDGENIRLNENLKEEQRRSKLLQERCASLENNVKSGLQVTKLRDENIDLENKLEDLRREMDIVVSELQSLKDSKKAKPRLSETPKTSKVISEWMTSTQVLATEPSSMAQSRSHSNMLTNEKSQDNLLPRIQALQNQKHVLMQRLNLLTVYNKKLTGDVNQLFIDNLNKMVQNLITFMTDFEGLSQDTLSDVNIISDMATDITNKNFGDYFEHVEMYLRNAITTLLIGKDDQGETVAESVILNRGVQGVARKPSLEKLFRKYLTTKNQNVLGEIKDTLQ